MFYTKFHSTIFFLSVEFVLKQTQKDSLCNNKEPKQKAHTFLYLDEDIC